MSLISCKVFWLGVKNGWFGLKVYLPARFVRIITKNFKEVVM